MLRGTGCEGARGLLLLDGLPGSGKTEQLIARAIELAAGGRRSRGRAPARALRASGGRTRSPTARTPREAHGRAPGTRGARSAERGGILRERCCAARPSRADSTRSSCSPIAPTGSRCCSAALAGGALDREALHAASALRAIERIDRLKEALVDAERYAAWAEAQEDRGHSRVRGASTPSTSGCSRSAMRSTRAILPCVRRELLRDSTDSACDGLRSLPARLLRRPRGRVARAARPDRACSRRASLT